MIDEREIFVYSCDFCYLVFAYINKCFLLFDFYIFLCLGLIIEHFHCFEKTAVCLSLKFIWLSELLNAP